MRPRKQQRHLPACVYQKHGAYYLVKKGRWTRLGTDLPTALAEYGRTMEAPTGGMADLIAAARPVMLARVSPVTAKAYEQGFRRLAEIFAEFSPEQVKPRDIAQLKTAMVDTPNMFNRLLSVLKGVFDYALEAGLVDSNPCAAIRRLDEAKRDRYITDAEYLAIKAAAIPRTRIVMDLLYLTGQRVRDVLELKLADLGSDGIYFQQGKTGTKLTVAWTPALRAVVEDAKRYSKPGKPWLFVNRMGRALDYKTFHDTWVDACTKAKVEDAHVHDLRAKALTDAKREGHNPTALAGHASAAMTERYIRLREAPVVQGPSFRQLSDLDKIAHENQ